MGRRTFVVAIALLAGAGGLGACGASRTTQAPVAVPSGPPIATDVEVTSAAIPGPPSSREQRATAASCPSGIVLLDGGALADLSDGKAPNPSLRLVGSLTSTSATPAGSGSKPSGTQSSWRAIVATGGVDQTDSRITAVALCGRLPTGSEPAGSEPTVVVTDAPGPKSAASNARDTATCPTGTVLIGGGGWVSLSDGQPGPPQYFLTGSYPSTAGGVPAEPKSRPRSWTAIGALGGAPMTDGRVEAVAECVPGAADSVTVAIATDRGPTTPETAEEVTAVCPTRTVAVGGGMYAGPSDLHRTLQGLHLRGSFPSDAAGKLLGTGRRPTSWSVVANAGGIIALGARTTSYALCTRG